MAKQTLYLASTRPELTWGSLMRIPLAVLAMIAVTGAMVFLGSRMGLRDLPLNLDGYVPFGAGLVAAYAVLRLLGRWMPHKAAHYITIRDGVAKVEWPDDKPLELRLDSVDVVRGEARPELELSGDEGRNDRPLVIPKEVRMRDSGRRFVLSSKYQSVNVAEFETMKLAGRSGWTSGTDYVQLLWRDQELIPAAVRVRLDNTRSSSATWHRLL